jgi:signal transduction histidine kinase
MTKQLDRAYGAKRITGSIVRGSFYVAVSLTSLLIIYDLINGTLLRTRVWIACGVIIYLVLIRILLSKGYLNVANWLIILLYEILAGSVLLYWGLSSVVGILTASFAILLPGVLMAPRYILPVFLITFGVLALTHFLQVTNVIIPKIYIPSSPSSMLDVIAYITILAVFALVSWISARQSSISLDRALSAEEKLRKQKNLLARELEIESTRLRQAQLQQIQQLYRFAVIGQSATATLHELSNHLSVLNLDIDDIKQQHKHSKAIANAEDGIEYINRMVRKARLQLNNSQDQSHSFNIFPAINQVVKDLQNKFSQNNVILIKLNPSRLSSLIINGDPMNLMQCITILLNNAVDACANTPDAKVYISIISTGLKIKIRVSDNGPGINLETQKTLFQPLESTKPTGLGVGLYIARHLIESQFKGTLKYVKSEIGATFQITLKKI